MHTHKKTPISFVKSVVFVWLSACFSSARNGRIFLKYDVGELYGKLSMKSKVV